MTLVVLFPTSVIFSRGIETVTLQVYSPPCDVSRCGNNSLLFSETRELLEFSHCTLTLPTKLGVTLKLQSIEKLLPAMELTVSRDTLGSVKPEG